MKPQQMRKYNPGFLTDAELVDTFCVRQVEFESVLDTLRGCTGSANQPQIVIGPRGSGKTTLLLRVAAEVRRDSALSARFFPVLFAEESYEVSSAGEFWLECLSQLADQAPTRPDVPDLHRTVEAARGDMDDRSLADRCLGAVLDFAEREDKRVVLFVENLNMLFRDMADPDAGWRLRKVLQTEPRIVLIASATNRFDEMDHPDRAFYDMFRVCFLRRLDTAECAALWERVSGKKVEEWTIRSLEILTGGSPRLVAIVARFGAARSFRNLMDELLDLVDDHSEYFKSHLEALPPQERRVYLALADLWKPATTREIAERCRLGTSKCSAQLKRLMDRGVVEIRGGTARRKEYYLKERLYNIYYLLRRRRGHAPLVEALVRFMQSRYGPKEIIAISAQMRCELHDCETPQRAMFRTALEKLATKGLHAREEAEDEALFNRGMSLFHEGRLDEAFCVLERLGRRFGASDEASLTRAVAATLTNQIGVFCESNQPVDALSVCNRLLDHLDSGTPGYEQYVASLLVNKGTVLAKLDQTPEAMEVWEEVERRFGANDEPSLQDPVAIALANRGATLRERGSKEAITVLDEVVRRFGGADHLPLRAQVARALVDRGVANLRLNRMQEAMADWDDVVHRYASDSDPPVLQPLASALGNKAFVLDVLQRGPEVVAVCDEMIRRFGSSDVLALQDRVRHALVLKGEALSRMDRPKEALSAFTDALRRSEENGEADIRKWRHQALVGQARIRLRAREYEAVIETISRVLDDGYPKIPGVLWRAYAARAEAAFSTGDSLTGDHDTKELLALLMDLPSPQYGIVLAVMNLSAHTGPEKMIHLIEASTASDYLLPLAIALRQELGISPRVAIEVEEVAKDLRRDLAQIRRSRQVPTP